MGNEVYKWGRILPEEMKDRVAVTWGARAIYERQQIDLLHDRLSWWMPSNEWEPEGKELMKTLGAWLDSKGLPFLREQARTLYTDESRVVSMDDGLFHIEASPQRSYGYLYIRAWMLKEAI